MINILVLSIIVEDNEYKVIIADKLWLTSNIPFPDLNRFDKNTARKIGELYEINKKN